MEQILEYKGYYGGIKFSSDDNKYYGNITGISDLVTYEASTLDEIKNEFNAAVEDYLNTCITLKKNKK